MKHQLKINKFTGEMQWLVAPPFEVRTRVTTRRFSEIVPVPIGMRIAFRLLRYCFGEYGKVAAWTRTWSLMWRMTILEGKHKGFTMEHGDRALLIREEKAKWFEIDNAI